MIAAGICGFDSAKTAARPETVPGGSGGGVHPLTNFPRKGPYNRGSPVFPILMALRILHDTATLTISYDYANEWLQLDWHGNLDDESVMEGALKLLELLKQERCTKVLNDNTHITGLWADAAKWGSDVFLPMLHEAGCRYFSWVYSPERYSQLSAELVVQRTTSGIVIMTFRDLHTAAEWLRQM